MATVTIHALDAGHLTLPDRYFVSPHDPEASRYVPSLSFLIQHTTANTNKTTRILFDLGMRRDIELYPPAIQAHCRARRVGTRPDVVESLARGGLTPDDIDYIILSHVHYDHVGYPKDFSNPKTKFIVGPGACSVLSGDINFPGVHSTFEPDLLPPERIIELPPTTTTTNTNAAQSTQQDIQIENSSPLKLSQWVELPPFSHIMDIFGDSSVYIVNAPGHLPGHINLLCRRNDSLQPSVPPLPPPTNITTATSSQQDQTSPSELEYVLLAGDSFHDARLLEGTHSIATFETESGDTCAIHSDIAAAEQMIRTLREVRDKGIEIVTWHRDSGTGRFMTLGNDQTIEIQKGWFGDPRAQDPGRMESAAPVLVRKHANVEIIFAHDEVWEQDAKDCNRFWPGQL